MCQIIAEIHSKNQSQAIRYGKVLKETNQIMVINVPSYSGNTLKKPIPSNSLWESSQRN
jgi:hypothetical protein